MSDIPNFMANQPIVKDQTKDCQTYWLDSTQRDEGDPWLFYGEDEDFIDEA